MRFWEKSHYYDGINEAYEYDNSDASKRHYVHGTSYVDERLMLFDFADSGDSDDAPYYYVLDRMYNVRYIVDETGALVERYCYDSYGRPPIREAPGRCDFDNDGDIDSSDEGAKGEGRKVSGGAKGVRMIFLDLRNHPDTFDRPREARCRWLQRACC
ncbi:MAG: hypothetical protein GY783_09535 [Gammaproteobacteria bacterium]|nr:hypothetical protein [Gammaproteobacteria bacterium]